MDLSDRCENCKLNKFNRMVVTEGKKEYSLPRTVPCKSCGVGVKVCGPCENHFTRGAHIICSRCFEHGAPHIGVSD